MRVKLGQLAVRKVRILKGFKTCEQKKISGPNREAVLEERRKLNDERFHDLYYSQGNESRIRQDKMHDTLLTKL
jgi:hypothetical protein